MKVWCSTYLEEEWAQQGQRRTWLKP